MDKRTKLSAAAPGALQPTVNDSATSVPTRDANFSYRPPEIISLGSAVGLIKQSSSGQLIDGNEGWWVWGS